MSSHSASQLFDVFVEAKSALEELPKVKADLAAAQSLIDETNDRLHNEVNSGHGLRDELAKVQASLAAREAELARITFQHETLRSAIGAINDTVRSVSDRPVSEPVAEPVPQPVSEASQGQSATDPTTATPHQTQEPADGNGAEPVSGVTTANLEAAPSPLAPPSVSDTVITFEAEPTITLGVQASPNSPTPSEDREPMGEAAASSNLSDKPPYLGWGSHRKPRNVTWGEFERLGGYRPHWCNPDLT